MPKISLTKNYRPDEVKRYPCPHCKIVFRRIEHVKAHILSQHIRRTTVNGGSNSRSPSTSSGVSSTSSSNSEGIQIKQELKNASLPVMNLHCKKCKLTFPERVSYQKHMYAHAKQQQSERPANAIQVSNSSGQKVNLRELVSQIKTSKEGAQKLPTQKDFMQKLTGLGMEISLHPLRKNTDANDLGLVISSVQSVSQRFFDELEHPKQPLRANIGPFRLIKHESPLARTNGANGIARLSSFKAESPIPEDTGDRDPLELPSHSPPSPPTVSTTTTTTKPSTPILGPPLKKPKLEPDPGINDEVILSSTRRTSRAACTYNEADQPRHISIITKQKGGKTTKRRIFPCGQCTSKFENIETRKMHFLTVHGSAARSRKENKTPPLSMNEAPPIISHIKIPAYDEENDE